MSENFDLLGDPIPENWGKRGRPPHMPTVKSRNKVIVLLAMGWDDAGIAKALGITPPTLKKHYFLQLKVREEARFRLRATHLEMVWEQAKIGNVSAMKEFRKLMDKAEAEDAERDFLSGGGAPKRSSSVPVGKKEQAAEDAQTAGLGTDWGGDLLPTRTH